MALASSVSGRGNEEGSASVEPSSALEPWFIRDPTEEEVDLTPGAVGLSMEMEDEAWHVEPFANRPLAPSSLWTDTFRSGVYKEMQGSLEDFVKKYGAS